MKVPCLIESSPEYITWIGVFATHSDTRRFSFSSRQRCLFAISSGFSLLQLRRRSVLWIGTVMALFTNYFPIIRYHSAHLWPHLQPCMGLFRAALSLSYSFLRLSQLFALLISLAFHRGGNFFSFDFPLLEYQPFSPSTATLFVSLLFFVSLSLSSSSIHLHTPNTETFFIRQITFCIINLCALISENVGISIYNCVS